METPNETRSDDCGQRSERGQRIMRALRELPRERARAGFTEAVLARLDAPARPAAVPQRWVMAAALGLALALTAGLWLQSERQRSSRETAEARQLLDQIRSDHARLESELESLRRTDGTEPVLYLGGDEEVDLVLDLREVPELRGGAIRPARNEGAF